jgi:glycosyltransferase involved in cell wall biosynthesis
VRILFISQTCPWPLNNGTRQRIYYLVRGLGSRHHVTTVFPLYVDENDDSISELAGVCATVIPVRHGDDYAQNRRRFHEWAPLETRVSSLVSRQPPLFVMQHWSEALVAELRRLRSEQSFDAVWIERASTAEMARRAGFERFVTDLDALEGPNMRRNLRLAPFYWSKGIHRLEAEKAWRYERRLAGLNGPVVICKDADRLLFGRKADRVFVVPNCVPELPLADAAQTVNGRMLFVGDMQYEPNVDAVRYFHREILPKIREQCPNAHLVVVGRSYCEEIASMADNVSLIYEGEVDDLDRSFDRSSVFVVPMRRGGGTRLKVLEAFGRGIPVVSTSVGAEGLDMRNGIDLEIIDDETEFATACASLLVDAARRANMGTSARARVRAHYGWDVGVAAAERVLEASLSIAS